MTDQAGAPRSASSDPLRLATPRIDDVEARRARAAIEGRLFGGAASFRVGRYRVLGRLGAGGMGVVYRAHDPELARDVAVKVINAEAIGDAEWATASARLVREARAMARVAHPNVAHVYDVGTVDDGVFLAMELVEGQSLASWLQAELRPWKDVLEIYVEAGRGLVAAHAAGVIHRDFKPENVLVGNDGRARVGDFGLAGASSHAAGTSSDDGREAAEIDGSTVAGTLTRTGALLGTPKYMAPEMDGDTPASEKTDQFAFCVALYEGLYGRPPFEGDNVARYRRSVRRGNVLPPPPDTRVPGWIFAEIARGLAVAPDDRHASIAALLARLERALVDPRIARSRWRPIAVLAPLVGGAVALGIWLGNGSGGGEAEPATVIVSAPEPAPAPVIQTVPVVVPRVEPEPPAPVEPATKPAIKPTATVAADRRDERKDARARGRGNCYYREDRWDLISRSTARKRHVIDDQGTCFDCSQPVPSWVSISDACGKYWVCTKKDASACAG